MKHIILATILMVGLGQNDCPASEIGITSSTITIGQSAPLTGINMGRGTEFRRGALGWFAHVNETGGIYGRKINLVTLDDAYQADRAEENTKILLESSWILFGYVGAAPSLAGAKLFVPAGVPMIGPYSGEPSLHQNKMVWNLQGTYADEGRAAAHHMAALQRHNIAVLYQDDQLGKASLQGVREAAKENNLNVVAAVPVKRDGSDADEASSKLLANRDADAYFLATAYSNASHFVKAKRALNIAAPVYAQSAVGSDALMVALNQQGSGVMVTQVVPDPTKANNKLVLEFHRDTKPPYTYAGLQGYFTARVLTDAIKETGSSPTRSALMFTLRNTKGYKYGSLFVGPEGYRHVDIAVLSNKNVFSGKNQ